MGQRAAKVKKQVRQIISKGKYINTEGETSALGQSESGIRESQKDKSEIHFYIKCPGWRAVDSLDHCSVEWKLHYYSTHTLPFGAYFEIILP